MDGAVDGVIDPEIAYTAVGPSPAPLAPDTHVCRAHTRGCRVHCKPSTHRLLNSFACAYLFASSLRYLGSALAMLFVPYIARDFGPGAQFKASGLLALTWLAMWWRVGSDQPPDGSGSGGNRQASAPALIEEGGMEAVPPFNKKEDPTPLLPKNSADVGAGGARSPSGRGSCKPDASAGIPWGVLMQSSAVWAIVTNNFAFHYATYVLMSWLPTYFQSHIGVGLSDMSSWYTVSFWEDMHLRSSSSAVLQASGLWDVRPACGIRYTSNRARCVVC